MQSRTDGYDKMFAHRLPATQIIVGGRLSTLSATEEHGCQRKPRQEPNGTHDRKEARRKSLIVLGCTIFMRKRNVAIQKLNRKQLEVNLWA